MIKNHVKLQKNAELIKATAKSLGFLDCRIAEASFLENDAVHLEQWIKNGLNGKMAYMENYFDMRLDPRLLVPGAKSVISLAYNYFTDKQHPEKASYKISKYAQGKDYHKTISKKLKDFLKILHQKIGSVEGRGFVDSAPILERAWAAKNGLGWIGKNSLLIKKGQGSFFFIAHLVIDLPLLPDPPVGDYCGTCTKCVDACPTDAISTPYIVDSRKCISYLTIEFKESIPQSFGEVIDNWIFGCDICQDVCPWNRFSKMHNEPDFLPSEAFASLFDRDLEQMTKETFEYVFKGSAVKRVGYEGFKGNIKSASSSISPKKSS